MVAKSPKNVQATTPEQTTNLPVPFEEINETKAVELGPLIYTNKGSLTPYLEHIKASVNEVPDLTTAKGRDRIASLAAQVSRSKVAIEKPGRAYLKHVKAVVKPIEQHLKEFVDSCDALRDEVRAPLTKWEEEQRANQERLQAKVDYFGEEYQSMLENMPSNLHERAGFIKAVLDDIKAEPVGDDFESMKEAGEAAKAQVVEKMTLAYQAALIESDNQRKADEQAEQQRLAREQQIADEAAAKAKADAEAAAKEQIEAANAAAQKVIDDAAAEQRLREQQAQQDAANKQRAAQLTKELNLFSTQINEAQNSVVMQQLVNSVSAFNIPDDLGQEFSQVLSAYDVVYRAAHAKLSTMLRADEENKKALLAKEEADRKAANVEHRRKINQAVMQQLLALGATEELSKAIITAAAKGELGAMVINY